MLKIAGSNGCLVVAVSALVGFFLGNLSPFSVKTFEPFRSVQVNSVDQVSFADVAQRVNPSVVSVVSTKIVDLNQVERRHGVRGIRCDRKTRAANGRAWDMGRDSFLRAEA